jgi:hypothetical protein
MKVIRVALRYGTPWREILRSINILFEGREYGNVEGSASENL